MIDWYGRDIEETGPGLTFWGMIKWDLKSRVCYFYETFGSQSCKGVKALYTGLGVAQDQVEVETIGRCSASFETSCYRADDGPTYFRNSRVMPSPPEPWRAAARRGVSSES